MDNDQQLIIDYLKGEEKALEVLIQNYLKPVYNFIYRYANDSMVTEDIVQETFIKVWKNIKKFDKDKKFKTWLFQIAKNTALDYLKKKNPISFSALSRNDEDGNQRLAEQIVDSKPTPDEVLLQAESDTGLELAIEKLSATQRAVLTLYYTEQFNFREIGEILSEPLDTVKSRHQRAITTLRKILQTS